MIIEIGPARDAFCLRESAEILRRRAKRKTFALQVILRVLERTADKILEEGHA